jgi:hypothetical protein
MIKKKTFIYINNMKFEHQKLNQCMFFKENILQKIINEYNNHYKKYKDETYILQDSYLLLNNNNKYYCLITSKKVFYNNNQKDNNQSILYFFNNYDSNDFYIEIGYPDMINWDNESYLKNFQIIVFNRQLFSAKYTIVELIDKFTKREPPRLETPDIFRPKNRHLRSSFE